jgi:hypothetical protein
MTFPEIMEDLLADLKPLKILIYAQKPKFSHGNLVLDSRDLFSRLRRF